ncbi:MAG: hypothetical protein LBU91_03855, partial [Bacteroidales bacterium]|nr:hypothetical protein [Bacteroidales bacterium]
MKRIICFSVLAFLSVGLVFAQPSKRLENRIEETRLIAEKEEDPLVKTITLFQSDLETFDTVEQAVINSMIAECLGEYWQQNRYAILQRTPLANPDLTDIRTWDAQLLLQQCVAYYEKSLKPQEALQAIPVRTYKSILKLGDDESEIERPTLYDLLAFRA